MTHAEGFIKVASAIPTVRIADCSHNVQQIIDLMGNAADEGASIVVFPELCITGYTCADLFSQPFFIRETEHALDDILSLSHTMPIVAVVGLPISVDGRLYNCAAIIGNGNIYGIVPKSYLPTYCEFYESRWFTSGAMAKRTEIELCHRRVPFGTDLIFETAGVRIGIEICEDLWVPIPPSSYQSLNGANIIVNISASNEMVGKHEYLSSLIRQQSARTISAYIYSSCGYGESTTDVVFAGNAMIAENGSTLAKSERFKLENQLITADIDLLKLKAERLKMSTFGSTIELPSIRRIEILLRKDASDIDVTRHFEPYPFIPNDDRTMEERCSEIFNIQVIGLAQRYSAAHANCAVIGISGGLDSTLALLVAVRTMDKLQLPRTKVIGITMPGFGTTGRTYNNAVNLMHALGVSQREISIKDACNQHFSDINLDPSDRSVTYENSQARERTQILMDIANKEGGIVIGTGDLSELALGWATYNGDHMSMYGVNSSVPKTLVRYLVSFVAHDGSDAAAKPFLLDIIDTPISPELLPADAQGNIAQKTEDLVGPYELHDFFLYNFMRFGFGPKRLFYMARNAFGDKYSPETIKKWLIIFLRRFFNQQFKRSAMPDGPKVGSVSLSPRGDWRMPSDATSRLWLVEAENIDV